MGLARVGGTQARQGNRLEEFGQDLSGLRSDISALHTTQERQGNRLEEIAGEVGAILELLRTGGHESD